MTVRAPTGDGGVGLYPAGVVLSGAEGDELARGRRGLAEVIPAPAGDGTVRPHSAGMGIPDADGDEVPLRRSFRHRQR